MTIKVGVIHKPEGSIFLTKEELTDDILRDKDFYYLDKPKAEVDTTPSMLFTYCEECGWPNEEFNQTIKENK